MAVQIRPKNSIAPGRNRKVGNRHESSNGTTNWDSLKHRIYPGEVIKAINGFRRYKYSARLYNRNGRVYQIPDSHVSPPRGPERKRTLAEGKRHSPILSDTHTQRGSRLLL